MSSKITTIAKIHTDFSGKFGIPRQSGIVEELKARIVFEPEFRSPEAVRGLEQFSHLWLIWEFSENKDKPWSPTVRPPRLGGNTRVGVFATRSPFRPNSLGLSCVKLEQVLLDGKEGPVLVVSGADLMDGTPIFDIKPYIPYADSHPEASEGFTKETKEYHMEMEIPGELLEKIPRDKQAALKGVLEHDPRPSYQDDPERVYGFSFAGFEVRFQVENGVLTVCEVEACE